MSFAPGPPLTDTAVRLVLLGSGELGREVAIEALRLGCEVLAVDRYPGAPAMQVAQRHAVIDMTDAVALWALLEREGLHVVPTARAARSDGPRAPPPPACASNGPWRAALEPLSCQTAAGARCG